MSLNLVGRFPCTLGKGVLNESKNGALMYTVEVLINDEAGNPYPALRNNFVLVKGDGEMMQRNVEKLITLLGGQWDGTDPSKLESVDPTGIEAIATCADREWEGKVYTEIKWLDSVGGGMALPQQVDAKSVATKYGSKFRAAFGGKTTPAKAPAKAPSAAPVKPPPSAKAKTPPAPAPVAGGNGTTSTANDCWAALNAAMDGKADTEITDAWFALMETHAKTKTQTDVTAAQWGAIADAIATSDLPF